MAFVFEWDATKCAANLFKHDVAFEEAATVFHDALGRVLPDDGHSGDEDRFILLGRSQYGRVLIVVFTNRGVDRVRLISARPATRAERIQYEEARE